MGWLAALRVAFLVVVGLLFVASLLAILITGPVIVRAVPLQVEAAASSARLREDVARLCSAFGPRSFRHPGNLERVAAWIAREFEAAGLEVELQAYEVAGTTQRNVVARRAGSKPASGVVVVGAHYDTVEGTPGADDNASGVAVLLELARTLPPGDRPRRTLVLAAFSTEEPPFFGSPDMGSQHFARSLREAGTAVDLMIALDLVGYFSDEAGSQRFPFPGLGLLYPDRGDFIAVVGDLRSGPAIGRVKRALMSARPALAVHSFRASPSWAPVHDSDHASFRRLGYPAVLVTDTAFMRYAQYHSPEDTPDRLDYERMALLVEALHGVLQERKP